MGATPGGAGQLGLSLLKGGLTGVGQGLQQMNNPTPQYDFSKLAQGFRTNRQALGQGITPNAKRVQGMDPFSSNPYWGGDYT